MTDPWFKWGFVDRLNQVCGVAGASRTEVKRGEQPISKFSNFVGTVLRSWFGMIR